MKKNLFKNILIGMASVQIKRRINSNNIDLIDELITLAKERNITLEKMINEYFKEIKIGQSIILLSSLTLLLLVVIMILMNLDNSIGFNILVILYAISYFFPKIAEIIVNKIKIKEEENKQFINLIG